MAATSTSVLGKESSSINTEREGAMSPEDANLAIRPTHYSSLFYVLFFSPFSDWRHMPWLGTHAAKGPLRPLRRIIQGLDPKSTASMFARAQCIGEKRVGGEECFVLKVSADQATVAERSEGPAEVIRHVLYGYFSQRSGLLAYMEDSHLARVQTTATDTVYWETTIGSSIRDYREVDGVLVAHQGRSVATIFRFGEATSHHSRTTMEEVWRIDDVVFNVPGLSMDYFIPPAEILTSVNNPSL
ncbi:hypothetical protein Taro_046274 [Colocasia esculenta]|uniref:Uncharacterized protein n=1 Tax=Colocasia esculenta TaxID=4460 RepID=A0A843X5D6_COLES|nr:hypothetical protein [Colocasia esculenta]